jgi:hypothetical protein
VDEPLVAGFSQCLGKRLLGLEGIVSSRIIALRCAPSLPTECDKSQMYAQRYVPHLPAAGETHCREFDGIAVHVRSVGWPC